MISAYLANNAWSEAWQSAGTPRPHWKYLEGAWKSMDSATLAERSESLFSLLRENGVTYNIYREGHEGDWPLDMVPFALPSTEWASLERGLIQRAELQTLLFQDLYGPRKLLKEGVLPPEFLFGHPDWLPAAWPFADKPAPHAPLVGFDLTRTPTGEWRVLADRVQNPSGAGYALQNRVLLSKIFPSLYREAGVHRLVHWFRALRAELKACAPAGVDNPHVVLLSPGPGHETWFEHSYLATYLGLTLVRGQELELRGDRIWVRAIGGDRPVDVIWRRVNDAWCDPLYFRPDSLLGIPGLARAVQAGTVAVVNPLGVDILHNPALLAYLPRICKVLMGEELILPSLATWWCGDPSSHSEVMRRFDDMVFKPMFPAPDQSSQVVRDLSRHDAHMLRLEIEANPDRWVAQELCQHSKAPAWQKGAFTDHHVVLRTFACGNPRSGYRILPGGLTRMGATPDALVVSNQDGGISKDTWILTSEPERESLNREAVLAVGTSGGSSLPPLPPSAAENLFWSGRYLERALVLIRRLQEYYTIDPLDHAPHELTTALECVSGGLWKSPPGRSATRDAVLENANDKPGSLAFNLHWLAVNGRALRGIFPGEAQLVVKSFSDSLAGDTHLDIEHALPHLAMQLRALSSIWQDWAPEDPRRVFAELGQKTEWISILSTLLTSPDMVHPSLAARPVFEIDRGAPPTIVGQGDDLFQTASNDPRRPRSLVRCLEDVCDLLARIRSSRNHGREKPEAYALMALSKIALGELDSLPAILDEFTGSLQTTYFTLPTVPGWLQN